MSVGLKLRERIEIKVVRDPAELNHLVRLERRLKDVVFRVRIYRTSELLVGKTGLVDPRGGRPGQIIRNQRIDAEHRKGLLRKQHFAAGFSLHPVQDFQVFYEFPLLHNVGGGLKFMIFHYQSTRTGFSSTTHGRPY